MKQQKSDRRSFLADTGKLAGVGWLAMNAPMLLAAGQAAERQREAGKTWTNMTPEQALTFAAVVDQIIPPDDMPGASDAGVVYFIDGVLNGFMAGDAEMLKQGLKNLDSRAVASFPGSKGFISLSFDHQTEILRAVETTPFFNTMIFLTHCGMFAMPSWGGNRELGGWALLDFDNRHAWQPPFGYYDTLADRGESNHAEG